MKKSAAPSARAAADPDPRGDQRDAGGEGEHDRLEDELELRHAEVELGLEGREADQQAAHRERRAGSGDERATRGRRGRRRRLDRARRGPRRCRIALPIRVRPAPPISIRCVGPQRVTSWPKIRCQTSSSGKPISAKAAAASIAMPPSGAYQSPAIRIARAARLALGEDDREEAGGEDAEQAEEDQVVGRVGERAGVAAVVDVQRDVPVHAEQRDQQRAGGEQRRQRGPGGEAGVARRRSRRSGAGGRCGRCGAPSRGRAGRRWRAARRRWRG